MKRTGEATAIGSICVGVIAAILRLGFGGALMLGLIVGTTMALLSLRPRAGHAESGSSQRVVS
jgi:hypothetical protein